MAIKPIIQLKEGDFYNKDTILRKSSRVVTEFDASLNDTIKDLIDTLNHHRIAVGLSAPQIGVLSRLTVINVKKRESKEPIVIVNPELLSVSEERETKMEACMSLPFFQGEVERALKIAVAYQGQTGEKQQLDAEGFLARVILHELDHLDGILYVDRMLPHAKLIPAEFFREKEQKSIPI